jgi:signal transduction histidine kinase
LFRIAQEALSNVVKHSQATKTTIVLTTKAETIYLSIIDNGHGLDVDGLTHADERQQWGFIVMRERAEAAGGRCEIESNLGLGTTVLVEVPR